MLRKINTKDNIIADHISRRYDDTSAQEVFEKYGLAPMILVEANDKLFDLTAPW